MTATCAIIITLGKVLKSFAKKRQTSNHLDDSITEVEYNTLLKMLENYQLILLLQEVSDSFCHAGVRLNRIWTIRILAEVAQFSLSRK